MIKKINQVLVKENLSEQFVIRVTKREAAALDQLMKEGGFRSRNALVRSLLQAIVEDEAAA